MAYPQRCDADTPADFLRGESDTGTALLEPGQPDPARPGRADDRPWSDCSGWSENPVCDVDDDLDDDEAYFLDDDEDEDDEFSDDYDDDEFEEEDIDTDSEEDIDDEDI